MADALLLHISSTARATPLSSPSSSSSLCLHHNPYLFREHRVPAGLAHRGRALVTHVKAHDVIAEKDESKWWEKKVGENMIDVNSPKEFLDALSQAGDRLVIVEFYNTWCASCRGLFPKLCKTAEEHPEITFVKVKFDENKPMCKRLNLQKIKDAIALHNTPSRVTGPPLGVGDLDLFNGPYPTAPRGNSR